MSVQKRNVALTTDAGPTLSWRFVAFAGISLFAFGGVLLWMLPASEFIPLVGHQHGVNDVTFSPDGNSIATASDDMTIRTWNRSGTPVTTVTGHSDRVTAVVFDPSGQELISASGKGEIRIWDVATGIEINSFKAHKDSINGISINSAGTELSAVSWDSTLSVWNIRTGKMLHRKTCPKVAECCTLTMDESALLVGCVDGVIRAWNVSEDTLTDVYAQHVDQVKALQFSSDGTLVLSCGRDHRLSVWKYPSGETVSTIRYGSPLRDAVFCDGESKILACAEDGSLLLFDCRSQRWLSRLKSPATQLLTIAVSRDELFACGGYGDRSEAMLFTRKTTEP